MNLKQKMTVIGIDILVLAELSLALYWSSQGGPDNAPGIFLKIFIPSVLATIILGRMLVKRLGTDTAPTESLPLQDLSGRPGVAG